VWGGLEMARHLRVEFPGAIYHVTCRMIGDRRLERSQLFRETLSGSVSGTFGRACRGIQYAPLSLEEGRLARVLAKIDRLLTEERLKGSPERC